MNNLTPLIELFRANQGNYVSGEQISQHFSLSRTAVWKKINKLKQLGFTFEASPRLGYRLLSEPSVLDIDRIQAQLTTSRIGRGITYLEQTDSTQNIARQLSASGIPEGHICIAETQTAGRGRMGRAWHSPQGKGLWYSMVLRPTIPLRAMSHLTLLTAVVLCETIREQTNLPVGIKWPNDLLLDGKKVSGILLETIAEDDRVQSVICGIGISVNLGVDEYPDDLKAIAQSLAMAGGQAYDREALLVAFCEKFEQTYELYLAEGFDPIRARWEAQSVTLNKQIEVQQVNRTIAGLAVGIDEQGALLVHTSDGEVVRCYSGDVRL
jgi:BirA family biotin operon repressor/biotin-[acetyl-CoA-carboxylase] ligase